MRLHLDTRDLIDLLERNQAEVSADEFRTVLIQRDHTLALSFPLICEITEPLWNPASTTSVTRTLRLLEGLPHEWIDIGHLPDMEVQAAIDASANAQPYQGVNPYVRNYIETLFNPPQEARLMINYELSKIIFDLWQSGSFDPRAQKQQHVATYRELFSRERQLLQTLGNKLAARKELFIQKVIARMTRLNPPGIAVDPASRRQVAEMIYQNLAWCPSTRLAFEAFHSLVDDCGDQLEDGDLGDFFNLQALPYVDLFTADRRFTTHIARVDRRLGLDYSSKVRRNVAEVVPELI